MKQGSTGCLMKWLVPMMVYLLPFIGMTAEPAKGFSPSSAIDMSLPIHQKQKLHPELSDPVLGDQAQIIEWAWSPQYAKRFNLPVQPDGLKDGGLWLIGIKVVRQQYQDYQRYTCNIVGLMDNKLPILTPPGDRYVAHPSDVWVGGLPGKPQIGSPDMAADVKEWGSKSFSPSIQTWYKNRRANDRKLTRKIAVHLPNIAIFIEAIRLILPISKSINHVPILAIRKK